MGRNTFYQYFECGESAEVYWTYDLLVIKLEDCTNILKDLNPGIDFIFLFDHSCGRYRGREYRLNVKNSNCRYCRAQHEMQTIKINQEVGHLGLHEKIIGVGDEHHMVLQEGGFGPFWTTPQECTTTKFRKYDKLSL